MAVPDAILSIVRDKKVATLVGFDLTEAQLASTVRFAPGEGGGVLPKTGGPFLAFDADNRPVRSAGTGVDAGLRTDLVAPTGASLVAYLASLPKAKTRSQEDRNGDQISLFDFIPNKAIKAAILARTLNNSMAQAKALAGYIQDAIDGAASQRRRLHVPAGLYNIAPPALFTAEGGDCLRCFAIRSYMEIDAEAGASFRIVDGVSTDAAPMFMCMFGTNEVLNDVSWRGLEMDMNGAGNPISPNRGNTSLPYDGYSLVNQAQIHVTGTPGGVAARINGALVERCKFVNTPGVSCLVMGQSNVLNSGVGSGWKVLHNEFRNNGYDTVDHSSVYGWAEDCLVAFNLFENDVQYGPVGGNVAYEVHGARTTFRNNIVRRYYQGMWIDGNYSNPCDDTLVESNTFDKVGAFGVMFFGRVPTGTPIRRTVIRGNQIIIDNGGVGAVDLKNGIGCTSAYSIIDVSVTGNWIRATGGPAAAAGIVLAAGNVAGEKHDRWFVDNNVCENTQLGIALSTNSTVGLGKIVFERNKQINQSVGGVIDVPQGISYGSYGDGGGLIDHLVLKHNDCDDDRAGAQCAFGIRLQGNVNRLTAWGNTATGMTSAPYAEAGFTALSRVGRFVWTIPYDPVALALGASTSADVSVPGAVMGDKVTATFNVDLAGLDLRCWVSAPGNVKVKFVNDTGGSVDLGSGTITVTLDKVP